MARAAPARRHRGQAPASSAAAATRSYAAADHDAAERDRGRGRPRRHVAPRAGVTERRGGRELSRHGRQRLSDFDGDGVVDNADNCPTMPAAGGPNGCPVRPRRCGHRRRHRAQPASDKCPAVKALPPDANEDGCTDIVATPTPTPTADATPRQPQRQRPDGRPRRLRRSRPYVRPVGGRRGPRRVLRRAGLQRQQRRDPARRDRGQGQPDRRELRRTAEPFPTLSSAW